MRSFRIILPGALFVALALTSSVHAQTVGLGEDDFLEQDQAFRLAPRVENDRLLLRWMVADGYYLYKGQFRFRLEVDGVLSAAELTLPAGKEKTDVFFGDVEVYYHEVTATASLPDEETVRFSIRSQGCADAGLCYPPTTQYFQFASASAEFEEVPGGFDTASSPANDTSASAPVSEQARLAEIITGSGIWVAAGVFFLAGLGLAFTPCVLPMVPILSGIIAGEGDDVSPMRGFMLALSYVMGMAIVYTLAGVTAAAAGLQLQAMFNQPWILILFAGLFVVLAFGMFGAYDMQMPSGIQSRLSRISGNQKSGTTAGVFVMGALSALIVTACVAPALVAALTVIAQSGDMLRGGSALFAMSLGMGAPLLAVGAAQGKFLPKAGAWMIAVKNAFGFMMLGLAIWMLSRILPGTVTMLLWAILVIMTGVFMGGLTTLTSTASAAQKLGKGFGFLTIAYGTVLLIGSLSGGSNPLNPMAAINLGGGGSIVADTKHELPFKRIKSVEDLDREIAKAAANGNSAFLDFYADWCVSCLEMEAYTFTDSDVQAALSNTIWLQADVTANDEVDQALLKRFGVFGPPTIIFFGTDGKQRHGYEVVGYMKAPKFANHVRQALPVAESLSVQVVN